MPSVEAFVITPVSAHSLTHRPLVVRDVARIEIVAKTGSDEAYFERGWTNSACPSRMEIICCVASQRSR